jgi:hypothetical protein
MVFGTTGWNTRPGVLNILALTVICIVVGLRIIRKGSQTQATLQGGER